MKIAYRFLFVLLISMFLFGCGEKTASVEGKIVDGKGKAVSDCTIMFKQVTPTQGYEQFETKTGPDGIFRLTGAAPSSDYVISILSDKWKTNVTSTIKTLEAGKKLVLSAPIKIRYNQMKDGSVVDTKTGLQWLIHPVSDITASNVMTTVQGLKEGGFSDWRLPTREELAGFQIEKADSKKPAGEAGMINKTCCAWVIDTATSEVDWKFYVEDENELWSSSKETPDNRIVVVRSFSAAPAAVAAAPGAPAQVAAPAAPTGPAAAEGTPVIKPTPPGIKFASRKACADKRRAAQAGQAAPGAAPVAATPAPAATASATAVPVTPPPAATSAPKPVAPAPVAVASKPAPVAPAAPAPVSASSPGTISLYFDLAGKTLKAQEIAKLKDFITKHQGAKGVIIIDGHSDASGTSATNLILTMHRTAHVASLINNMGVSKDIKIELRASGDSKPAASNDTAEGRDQNRRVEVSFMAR
ncbi:MAG: Outer membrane protein Omp38 precursor [Deltaproteobacteria bacterium ADurb.Bin151]|nr:OmpA family protein [Smithella sp.]OQB56680.1 MAG: Outer membrane protein Omp38 precursor [Deltaproteobacteria bacterium ADurb.Bin151]HNZ10338.1 OmpA family protein [Smithellaceae bacterium]HOG81326.1 OmpA family protein [Smithellaceae bacterium]HOQ41288.1 OmpA family protein [Smithellaceae bacterium]